MTNWSGQEKRRHKRVALHVPVECRSSQSSHTCQAENISSSGLLIRTASPFPQDEELDLRFAMPESGRMIECRARVAHIVPDAFMGVRFMDLAPESAEVIEAYVAQAPALQARSRQ